VAHSMMVKRAGKPHNDRRRAKVRGFSAKRLVCWLQDELQRFNEERAARIAEEDSERTWEPFTLHDFRRTAITGMQMAGVTEKEASVMVGATPDYPQALREAGPTGDCQAERRAAAGC
jgi:hypothetical protein